MNLVGHVMAQQGTLVGHITSHTLTLQGRAQIPIVTNAEPYEGAYDIEPTVEGFVMETADKLMLSNVTVKAIPFHSVSNPANGNTVIIAGDGTMEV